MTAHPVGSPGTLTGIPSRAGSALAVDRLTKRYGAKTVLDEVSFEVRPGTVTAFVGPNGAGKSTTLRVVAGLDRPTSGRVLVDGRPLEKWSAPARKAGFALSVACAHPGRTARDSVRWVGSLLGRSARECDQALDRVGLGSAAHRRTRGFSLGMRQRLALAIALLGDPELLVLDEPMNGLDPDGIAWVRELLVDFRSSGRTVFFGTHLLAEVEDVVDDVVVIAGGRVVDAGPAAGFLSRHSLALVSVRCADAQALAEVVQDAGGRITRVEPNGRMQVAGLEAERIGALAGTRGIAVYELSTGRTLHGAFDELTRQLAEPAPAHAAARAGSLLEGAR